MWNELCEMKDAETINYVVEFKWKQENMDEFFAHDDKGIHSALVKITVEDPDDSDNDDVLKFRVHLDPEKEEGEAKTFMGTQHHLVLQLVGGKSSSRVYGIFFHTIN